MIRQDVSSILEDMVGPAVLKISPTGMTITSISTRYLNKAMLYSLHRRNCSLEVSTYEPT